MILPKIQNKVAVIRRCHFVDHMIIRSHDWAPNMYFFSALFPWNAKAVVFDNSKTSGVLSNVLMNDKERTNIKHSMHIHGNS